MSDQRYIADQAISLLKSSGNFSEAKLIGSVAVGSHDEMSDIDILVESETRPPWKNVELASEVIAEAMGVILSDRAGALIPEKYQISHFLPDNPVFWYIDIGCMRSSRYEYTARDHIDEDKDEHLAKLLVMNAKHYLRGNKKRLRIRELFGRACDGELPSSEWETFKQVYESIDYTKLQPVFRELTEEVIVEVANKQMQADAAELLR